MSYKLIVETFVKNLIPRDSVHGLDHVERVRRTALFIAKHYPDVDLEVVEIAALMHDIGKYLNADDHAKESAKLAKEILKKLKVPEEKISKIIDAIENHSFSARRKPKTLEGMILSDADKLDALGAIGIARVFMLSGIENRDLQKSLKHFYEKILKLYNNLFTDIAKELAKERIQFTKKFINQLEKELNELKEFDVVDF